MNKPFRKTVTVVTAYILLITGCGTNNNDRSDNYGDVESERGTNSQFDNCGMCTTITQKCDWDAEAEELCFEICEAEQEHPKKCADEHDIAMSCFRDENNWDCSSLKGLVGCDDELRKYHECRINRWEKIDGLPSGVNVLYVYGEDNAVLYAGTGHYGSGGGLYKSEDKGMSWISIKGDLPNGDFTALAVTPNNNDQIYVARGNTVYRTDNGGKTWSNPGTRVSPARDIEKIHVADNDGNKIYCVVDEDGFFRSDDGGKTWRRNVSGLPLDSYDSVETHTFAVDPSDPSIIYLGTDTNGVFKSVDGGVTWTTANNGMLDVRIAAIEAVNSQLIYAAGDPPVSDNVALFRSEDAGETWTDIIDDVELDDDIYSLGAMAVDPSDPEKIFLFADTLNLIVRTDSTWRPVAQMPEDESLSRADPTDLVMIPSSPPVVIAATDVAGAWRYVEE